MNKGLESMQILRGILHVVQEKYSKEGDDSLNLVYTAAFAETTRDYSLLSRLNTDEVYGFLSSYDTNGKGSMNILSSLLDKSDKMFKTRRGKTK